jgi:hypothetical protein
VADATPLAFVGTKTTGCNPDQHEIWEVAVITWPEGTEHAWLLPVEHLAWADAKALGTGNFHRRHPQGNEFFAMNGAILARDRGHLAGELAQLTHGRHLAGGVRQECWGCRIAGVTSGSREEVYPPDKEPSQCRLHFPNTSSAEPSCTRISPRWATCEEGP